MNNSLYAAMNEAVLNQTSESHITKAVMIYDISEFFIYKNSVKEILINNNIIVDEHSLDTVAGKVLSSLLNELLSRRSLDAINEYLKLVVNVINDALEELYITEEVEFENFNNLSDFVVTLYNHSNHWMRKIKLDKFLTLRNDYGVGSVILIIDEIYINFMETKSEMYTVFKLIERI